MNEEETRQATYPTILTWNQIKDIYYSHFNCYIGFIKAPLQWLEDNNIPLGDNGTDLVAVISTQNSVYCMA